MYICIQGSSRGGSTAGTAQEHRTASHANHQGHHDHPTHTDSKTPQPRVRNTSPQQLHGARALYACIQQPVRRSRSATWQPAQVALSGDSIWVSCRLPDSGHSPCNCLACVYPRHIVGVSISLEKLRHHLHMHIPHGMAYTHVRTYMIISTSGARVADDWLLELGACTCGQLQRTRARFSDAPQINGRQQLAVVYNIEVLKILVRMTHDEAAWWACFLHHTPHCCPPTSCC